MTDMTDKHTTPRKRPRPGKLEVPFVRWENPPERNPGGRPAGVKSQNNGRSFAATAGFLRAYPGRWALVVESPRGGRYGRYFASSSQTLRRLGCEVTARSGVEGLSPDRLYARYPAEQTDPTT